MTTKLKPMERPKCWACGESIDEELDFCIYCLEDIVEPKAAALPRTAEQQLKNDWVSKARARIARKRLGLSGN